MPRGERVVNGQVIGRRFQPYGDATVFHPSGGATVIGGGQTTPGATSPNQMPPSSYVPNVNPGTPFTTVGPSPGDPGYIPSVTANPFTTPSGAPPSSNPPGSYAVPTGDGSGYTDPNTGYLVDPSTFVVDMPDECDPRVRMVVLFAEIPFLALVALHPRVPGLLRLGAAALGIWDALQMAKQPSMIGP